FACASRGIKRVETSVNAADEDRIAYDDRRCLEAACDYLSITWKRPFWLHVWPSEPTNLGRIGQIAGVGLHASTRIVVAVGVPFVRRGTSVNRHTGRHWHRLRLRRSDENRRAYYQGDDPAEKSAHGY